MLVSAIVSFLLIAWNMFDCEEDDSVEIFVKH